MKTDTIWRLGGLLVGAGMALVAVFSWRMPDGGEVPGADVRVLAAPTGELDVSPTGPFLSARGLKPGRDDGGADGDLVVRNQTGSPLTVRARLLPSGPQLDALLVVRLSVDGQPVLEGTLGQLRDWSSRSFELRSGQRERLQLQVSIPPGAPDGYQGQVQDVSLELQSTRKGR